MRVFVYYIGRAKEAHANAIAEDFVGRTAKFCACEMREINPLKFDVRARHPAARKIYLDPAGKEMDSSQFSRVFADAEMNGQDLVFLVGAHEGLTAAQRAEADVLLSLSRMTWPHELARAMLAEQIYRAFAMLRKHPYVR